MPNNTIELAKQSAENIVQEINKTGEQQALTFLDSIYKMIEGNETLKGFVNTIINIFNKIKEIIEVFSGILGGV